MSIEKAKEVLSWCQENADEKWMVDHLALVQTHLDQALAELKSQEEKIKRLKEEAVGLTAIIESAAEGKIKLSKP